MIVFAHVDKSFASKVVVRDIALELPEGGCHFIAGYSGAGKSVLIKMAIGLLKPDHGHCYLDEFEVSALDGLALEGVRRRCQMVFQHSTLFDSLTLRENIAMPLRKRFKLSRPEAEREANSWLEQIDCLSLADKLPAMVGQGVQKQVAIARAMAMKPRYILYDEPTTGLTPLAARRTDQLIHRLSVEHGVTAVVVSHDMTSLRTIADTVHFLYDTKLLFSGATGDFLNNGHPVLREFVTAGCQN